MTPDPTRICVFLGSSTGLDPVFAAAARALGEALARGGRTLVYGGGNIGLMGILANTVLERGGTAIGVIPRALVDRELAHRELTELHVVDSMHERKALMADLSDGFIAMPGGLGTLEELFEVLTWAQLGIHAKPVALMNAEGYFDSLLEFLDRGVDRGFIPAPHRRRLIVGNTPDGVLSALAAFEAPPVKAWAGRQDL